MPRLRDAVLRLQNRSESVFYRYCSGNHGESYTGCKNEILEQNSIQRLLHSQSHSFTAAQHYGRLSLKESGAKDMLINVNAGWKQIRSERNLHKRKSKKNEHSNYREL